MSSPSSPEAGPRPRTLDDFTAGRDARSGDGPPALLDVRDDAAFAAGHVAGSGHVPADALERLRPELPPRDREVVVIAESPASARASAETLAGMGYARAAWLDAPIAALGERARDLSPAARLWRPAEFLAEVVAGIPHGRAADLAAGSGRDAVFLAMQGFEVEAWDHAPEALEMARGLAGRSGVRVDVRHADLESDAFRLDPSCYALVTCFRFLHRPLFATMAAALAPGGHLVYETYRQGQERYGRPRRARFLLHAGELRQAFEALGLEILRFEEPDPEGGPITSRLWARRNS